MQDFPLIGPASLEHGWVPAPRYLMRRSRILDCIASLAPDELLEVGCGAGALLLELHAMGFRCSAIESSRQARQLATRLIEDAGLAIPLYDEPQSNWANRFGVICAFDVLEHMEKDDEALATWAGWLKPRGALLLSVPARMSLWTAADEWAGHFRRYERDGLIALLHAGGYEIVRFECYGFPLTNLTELIGSRVYAARVHRETGSVATDRRSNSDRSGIDRSAHLRLFPLLASPIGRGALRAFYWIQSRFLGYDLGSGYLVLATRE